MVNRNFDYHSNIQKLLVLRTKDIQAIKLDTVPEDCENSGYLPTLLRTRHIDSTFDPLIFQFYHGSELINTERFVHCWESPMATKI